MITLLPPPQQLRYTGTDLVFSGRERLYVSPSKEEDAAGEVLSRALAKAGCGAEPLAASLPGVAGATFAVAADPQTARDLARRAVQWLDRSLPTVGSCRDGVYMPDEPSLARDMAAVLGRDASDEAYALVIAPEGIACAGRSRRAMFWGVQTLSQILAGTPGGKAPGIILRDWPNQRLRGIHLDMPRLLPKMRELQDWLRGLASLKINTVLLEYVDKFPYQVHRFLRHPAAFTPSELRRLLQTARRHHIQVIPLIQSVAHLEHCLKYDELADLREMPDVHTQVCPTNPRALDFVCGVIDEVAARHPEAEFFHIGGDEAGFLGACPRCRRAARRQGPMGLYLDHITQVLRCVIARGKRPILWDDMVRVEPEALRRLPHETVLGYWDYGVIREDHHPRRLPAPLEKFYRAKGKCPALWPDTVSMFPFFDFYRRKGFDVIAAPCLNYGDLAPNYPTSAHNTMKFAEKAAICGGLGTINVQWADFAIPIAMNWYGFALTAVSTWSWPPADTADFDMAFSRVFMGAGDTALLEAGKMVTQGVGFQPAGTARRFNLLHYALMDAELHYAEGMTGRRKYGTSYPPDLDFARAFQRKLELLASAPDRADTLARLDWVHDHMRAALSLLRNVRLATARGRRNREMLRAVAEFKRARIDTIRLLIGGKGRRPDSFATALRAEHRVRATLQQQYGSILHPLEVPRQLAVLFAGELAALQERRR